MSHPDELWTWEKCSDKIRSLPSRNGYPVGDVLSILGFELNLNTGEIKDTLSGKPPKLDPRTYRNAAHTIFYLLSAYSEAQDIQPTGKHISSRQFRGTRFTDRSYSGETMSLIRHFEKDPERLVGAARKLGGNEVNFPTGDIAVELYALPRVPITVVMKLADEEFETEAWLYFDETLESFFDSEQTYFLSHLMVSRLIEASTHQ
jgi:hypothetical protein